MTKFFAARADHPRPRRQIVPVDRTREQAPLLKRAGQIPLARRLGGDAEEAAVIFGVADHHQPAVGLGLGGFETMSHPHAAISAEEHLVGKEGVRKGRYRWLPDK